MDWEPMVEVRRQLAQLRSELAAAEARLENATTEQSTIPMDILNRLQVARAQLNEVLAQVKVVD